MDLLSHILIPLFILFIAENHFYLSTILLSFTTILVDFDCFFGLFFCQYHRVLFHTILIPFFFMFIGSLYFRKKEHKKIFRILFLISFFVLSHILFDISYGGVALFYPLSDKFYEVKYEVTLLGRDIGFNYGVTSHENTLGIDWRNPMNVSYEVMPGILAWRNAFMFLLLFLVMLPYSKKKFVNDVF